MQRTEYDSGYMYNFSEYESVASSPGPTQILSHSREEKSGEGLGAKLRHNRKWWLGYYVMWTRFHNDGNVPTHNVDRANSKSLLRCLLMVPGFASTKLLTNDV